MRKLLTLAIPMLLGVGLLTAAVHSDSPKSEQSKRSQGGVAAAPSLPAVIEEAAAPTTTTAAPETTTTTAAPAPTTTTTLAPVTTTTARKAVTPVTTPRPRPTTTTAPVQTQAAEPAFIDCGTGQAFANGTFRGDTVGAKVINRSTKAIELDAVEVTVTYRSGAKKQYSFEVAGHRIEANSGQPQEPTAEFSMPSGMPASDSMVDVVISDFRFHTAGLPECGSH
jgi:cytoskeletal protein RodZ